MSVHARRRRANSREHWRPLGIIGFAIVVHLAFLTFVPPPEGHAISVSVEEDPEDLESFDGVGGTFAVSPDCMSEAFAGAMARVDAGAGATARVAFEAPVAAVSPGQAAVFDVGERVLGGGWIAASVS